MNKSFDVIIFEVLYMVCYTEQQVHDNWMAKKKPHINVKKTKCVKCSSPLFW